MVYLLPIFFAGVAFLYSMAGFGGGSTYTALLVIFGLPLAAVPILSLICNLVVTSQGSFILIKKGSDAWKILRPALVASIPCAFLGGAWQLPESAFLLILTIALTLAGAAMLWKPAANADERAVREPKRWQLALTGALLGLLAGVTGIGGGIYLAPVMHLLRWSTAAAIATCTSLFIMLNSVAGLLGQLSKGPEAFSLIPPFLLIGCPLMVLVGGRIGSRRLATTSTAKGIRTLTGIVILLVAIRLWLRVLLG